MKFIRTGRDELIVELDTNETARFKRSSSFRVETIAEARKFAAKRRMSCDGTIDVVGGIRTGPIASVDMDPDGMLVS